ncbi:MAG: PadR family transcriptional regulator [Desulfobacula sp.]|jgi:DNA-binding PadR family transcriptional regulator
MSTIDLIILGILLNNPLNAFELTRFMDTYHIGRLVKISKPAVYKCCKRLFQSGFLDGETVREGEMPEKVIYSVNEKGRGRFYELMEHFSSNLNPFYFEFNSFIYHLDKMPKHEALKMLENFKTQLSDIRKWVLLHEKEQSAKRSFASKSIVKQYRMMIVTLGIWIDETIEDFKQEMK